MRDPYDLPDDEFGYWFDHVVSDSTYRLVLQDSIFDDLAYTEASRLAEQAIAKEGVASWAKVHKPAIVEYFYLDAHGKEIIFATIEKE